MSKLGETTSNSFAACPNLGARYIYKWHVCPGSYNLNLEMSARERGHGGRWGWRWVKEKGKEVGKELGKEMRMEDGKELGKEMRMEAGMEVLDESGEGGEERVGEGDEDGGGNGNKDVGSDGGGGRRWGSRWGRR